MQNVRYYCPTVLKLEFSGQFFGEKKTLKCQISWKSAQWVPSCYMRTDGQTDMTKQIIAFRNFAKRT